MARAQWKVEVEWDAITDRRSTHAHVVNEDGATFGFWFPSDGTVRATVQQSPDVFRSIDSSTLPIYRIDRDPPVDLGARKQEVEVKSRGGALGWRVGTRAAPPTGELAKLLEGRRLLVRITHEGGETRDLVFSLDGAERAYKLAAELQQ